MSLVFRQLSINLSDVGINGTRPRYGVVQISNPDGFSQIFWHQTQNIWGMLHLYQISARLFWSGQICSKYMVRNCGFCLSRILLYFPVSVVRVSSVFTGVTSQFFTFITCPRPYKPYIFWKLLVQGYQNWYYQVSHAQIHKYKYTNTQIQHMTKCQKDPTCGIFLKRGLFKDIKNYIPTCRTHKYKNTNSQIHKYSIWGSARKTQHVAYFWKEDCSRVSKIIFTYNTNLKIWVSHSCTRSSCLSDAIP